MAKNEDGEFELILGNRQLLSVFFIVVVLLGVFFTMGYIVGRNSGPMGGTEVVAARKDPKPTVIESAGPAKTSDPKPESAAVETRPQQADPVKTEPAKTELPK